MVRQQEKEQAVRYLRQRLEESRNYSILNSDAKTFSLRSLSSGYPIEVVVANFFPTVEDFEGRIFRNIAQRKYTSPVLYKDGKTAFVRMVDRNPSWREEKSLKDYTREEISSMLHLRKIEKSIFNMMPDDILVYYQPHSLGVNEALCGVSLCPVTLDYSHIGREHPSYDFVQTREAIDYKIPKETFRIRTAAMHQIVSPGSFLARIIPQ